MEILNLRRVLLVRKRIKKFDENNKDELKSLIELVYITNFSLKTRWGWSLSDLKNEIAFAKFPVITNSDDDYGSTNSIIAKIKKIEARMGAQG